MSEKAVFRTATEADVETLLSLMQAYYEFDGFAFDEPFAREALVGLLRSPTFGCVWLIECDGEVAGYLAWTVGYSLQYGGFDSFIDELYLAEPYRGRGLGGQVMMFVEAQARARGVKAIHLEVSRENHPAKGLYRKYGYEDHGQELWSKVL